MKSQNQKNNDALLADPKALAEWVWQYVLYSSHSPDSNDLDFCVPEDKMEMWGITPAERQADANEIKILRAAGTVWFVSSIESYDYFCKFKEEIGARTARDICGTFDDFVIRDVQMAFDLYLHDMTSDSPVGFFMTYGGRVYPGSKAADAIFHSGIPLERFKIFNGSNVAMREGVTQLKHGMSYEAYCLLNKLIEA